MANNSLTIFDSLSKELILNLCGQSIHLIVLPQENHLLEIGFSGESIRKSILSIGQNKYAYFFQLPTIFCCLEKYSIDELKALYYFAKNDIYSRFLDEHQNSSVQGMTLDESKLDAFGELITACQRAKRSIEMNLSLFSLKPQEKDATKRPSGAEFICANNLALHLKGIREVANPSGRIDVLTDKEVIELTLPPLKKGDSHSCSQFPC
jgi:hypothetical protein